MFFIVLKVEQVLKNADVYERLKIKSVNILVLEYMSFPFFIQTVVHYTHCLHLFFPLGITWVFCIKVYSSTLFFLTAIWHYTLLLYHNLFH